MWAKGRLRCVVEEYGGGGVSKTQGKLVYRDGSEGVGSYGSRP